MNLFGCGEFLKVILYYDMLFLIWENAKTRLPDFAKIYLLPHRNHAAKAVEADSVNEITCKNNEEKKS